MKRIYLDNAATSFPKPEAVWAAVLEQGQHVGANAGRGSYSSAQAATQILEAARVRLARLFHGEPERTILTFNCTDALNIALKGFLDPGDHVVTSAIEHNSVRRPLAGLERERGVEVTMVAADARGLVDASALRAALRPNTKLVALLHASNVCGTIQPIAEVGEICRQRRVRFLLDAAQTAGSVDIDMEALGVDFLAVPGHKGLLGPLGTGALLVAEGVDVRAWREGGTGSSSADEKQPENYPAHLEAGSANVPGLAGLVASLTYLEGCGIAALRQRTQDVAARFFARLVDTPGLEIGGEPELERREPIFPVRLPKLRPDELAALLDASYGIEVRAGLHCAPGAHRALGTYPDGSVRISLGPFTSAADVDAAADALEEIAHSSRS